MFESVDGRTDGRTHGRRLESHPISSGELKNKIPAIPRARRRHGYKLLVHKTSQSEYNKGDCLEVEESQCRSRPCNTEILSETAANPETVTVNYSYIPVDIHR